MRFRIKNWKLAFLAVLFICFFTSLGMWQLARAQQKKILLKSFAERTLLTPLTAHDLDQHRDLRFYQARITGTFDNAHTLLLDNKISHSSVGYEVYTPFKIKENSTYILVDRGFVPMGKNRSDLPIVPAIQGAITIIGMLNLPPRYVAFGALHDDKIKWPLRVEYINQAEIEKLFNYSLLAYTLSLKPADGAAFTMEWQAVTMPPERHMGYAAQWFALALTLLILFVALNCDRSR